MCDFVLLSGKNVKTANLLQQNIYTFI